MRKQVFNNSLAENVTSNEWQGPDFKSNSGFFFLFNEIKTREKSFIVRYFVRNFANNQMWQQSRRGEVEDESLFLTYNEAFKNREERRTDLYCLARGE